MTRVVTLAGASDDLIEVGGAIREEFSYRGAPNEGDLVAFSDGTVLRIVFSEAGEDGVWRITPVARGTATLDIVQAPEDDPANFTDVASLSGVEVRWAVHGLAYAKAVG